MDATVQQTLEQERRRLLSWMNVLRLSGVASWLLLAMVGITQEGRTDWTRRLPGILVYAVFAGLLCLFRKRGWVMRLSPYAFGLMDVPFIFLLQQLRVKQHTQPLEAAVFTLALYIVVLFATVF